MSTARTAGARTETSYWEDVYRRPPRATLPSRLRASTRNIQRLLRKYIRPGDRVLEIGCAPGKHLAWVAARLGATVAGVEYAPRGAQFTRELFAALGLPADVRCEDIFSTSFPPGSFDVVYSIGLIEHFEDPAPLVARHVQLARPGGTAVIVVPNYGGWYGRAQARLDPANLAIHNLAIMQPDALLKLAPTALVASAEVRYSGRADLALLNLHRRIPGPLALGAQLGFDLLSALQPVELTVLAPFLALVLRRRAEAGS